jgi:hypothetical protein
MELLATAVEVLTAVILLDIALTTAIIVRLRAVQERGSVPTHDRDLPRPGTVIGQFAAIDLDGRPVTTADLEGPALICFISPGCSSCERWAAELLADPPAVPVLAFIIGDVEQEMRSMADRLSALGRVCHVEGDDPVLAAFGVHAVPMVIRTWAGVVVAADKSGQLDEPHARRVILGAVSAGTRL